MMRMKCIMILLSIFVCIYLALTQTILAELYGTRFKACNSDKTINIALKLEYKYVDLENTQVALIVETTYESGIPLPTEPELKKVFSLIGEYRQLESPFVNKMTENYIVVLGKFRGILEKEEEEILREVLEYLSNVYEEEINLRYAQYEMIFEF